MKIEEILKEIQSDVYIKLNKSRRKDGVKCGERLSQKNKSKKTNIGNVSVEELMSNRCYRRGRGGAIKQVR